MTTKEIEEILYNHFWKKGWYGVFECAIPKCLCKKVRRERVDMITYETSGVWRTYEIKISKSDLHSDAALSWIGNYNYLVCTEDLIEDAQQMLPKDIGIYVVYESGKKTWIELIKNPKRRALLCSHEDMLFALMQGLSREYKKYRKMKKKEENSLKNRSKRK